MSQRPGSEAVKVIQSVKESFLENFSISLFQKPTWGFFRLQRVFSRQYRSSANQKHGKLLLRLKQNVSNLQRQL